MTAGPMLTADDIPWELSPAKCLPSGRLASLVSEIFPTIDDDLAADLREQLALALADHGDEARAIRAVLWAALDLAHAQHVENLRLKKRLADLLAAGRRDRVAA